MSDDTSLVPLPADITSLFEEERASAGLPAGARERLRSRIDLLGPIGGIGSGSSGDGGGGDGGGAGTGGAGGSVGAAGAAASGGALKGIIASKLAIAAVAFGVGGASGAAVHATLATPAAPAPITSAAPVAPSAAPSAIATFAPPASASSSALSVDDLPNAAPKPKSVPSTEASSKDGLKQERASLEVARTAITRGDYASAITALDRHASTFPKGQLAEERELMRIQALVGQGRGAEAKARATQFHRDFPQSLMKGAVDATVRSIP